MFLRRPQEERSKRLVRARAISFMVDRLAGLQTAVNGMRAGGASFCSVRPLVGQGRLTGEGRVEGLQFTIAAKDGPHAQGDEHRAARRVDEGAGPENIIDHEVSCGPEFDEFLGLFEERAVALEAVEGADEEGESGKKKKSDGDLPLPLDEEDDGCDELESIGPEPKEWSLPIEEGGHS